VPGDMRWLWRITRGLYILPGQTQPDALTSYAKTRLVRRKQGGTCFCSLVVHAMMTPYREALGSRQGT